MLLVKKEYEKQFNNWQKTVTESNKTAVLVETVGKGFREIRTYTIDSIDWSKLNKDSWVLVFSDFDLTATIEFYKHDITNIVFVSTDLSERQTVNKYFFHVAYPDIVQKMLVGDRLPWKAVLYLKAENYYRVGNNGKVTKELLTRYYLEGDNKEYMNKEFDSIIANFPFSLGNDITKFIIDNVKFKDGSFTSVLPISKYKKGTLTQYIIPDTIKNNTVKRQASDFDGADTYPIICSLSNTKTNELSFEDFERLHCCNREEGLGKKFFEEQDRRIAAEEAGTRKKAFVEQICMVHEQDFNKFDSKTAVSQNIWTPNIAHGWGSQEILDNEGMLKDNNYTQWNFKKVGLPINKVFNVTASNDIGQTETIMNTESGKDNILTWMHSAELNGKYRHCGLFTILLRWMNKTTCCRYDYILPRVDWDNRTWTDEEILKDYGYTDEEIEKVLRYNDDLVPPNWKKTHEDN